MQMPKPKLMKVSDAIAHVVDLVTKNHRMQKYKVEADLQALGFDRDKSIDIVSAASRKGLLRDDGSTLRAKETSKEPHLEQDYMTGWWGIYVNGQYAGQRPDKAQAQEALDALLRGS